MNITANIECSKQRRERRGKYQDQEFEKLAGYRADQSKETKHTSRRKQLRKKHIFAGFSITETDL